MQKNTEESERHSHEGGPCQAMREIQFFQIAKKWISFSKGKTTFCSTISYCSSNTSSSVFASRIRSAQWSSCSGVALRRRSCKLISKLSCPNRLARRRLNMALRPLDSPLASPRFSSLSATVMSISSLPAERLWVTKSCNTSGSMSTTRMR